MRRMRSKFLGGFLSLLIATLVVWEGQAQSQQAYPTRPIDLVVPVAVGGSTDLVGRIMANALSKKWGSPINVLNKPGGNYIPGMLYVYEAQPDGYTMMMEANSQSSLFVLVKNLPFKIMDRTFIGRMAFAPQVFIVGSKTPFKSLGELAEEAKRNTANFSLSWNGDGTDTTGLATRQFFKAINVDIRKVRVVSASGGGQGLILTAGGNVILSVPTLTTGVAGLQAGTVRGLAITAPKRNRDWPNIPTTAEAGFPTVTMGWRGEISGPPKLPPFVVEKWEKGMEEILRDPAVIAQLDKLGLTVSYLNSKETRETVLKEIDEVWDIWSEVK